MNPHLVEYTNTFIQRIPRYGVKFPGKTGWKSKNKPLSDTPIQAHLAGKYNVGVLGQWYPQYAVIDIDDRPHEFVTDLRDSLELDESNSMLFDSESADSYHLILKPQLNEKPPTINALQQAFRVFAANKGVEIYPQTNRIIRLPFGKYQTPADMEYCHLNTWQDKLYWFQKLDDFNISCVQGQQLNLDLQISSSCSLPDIIREGKELLEQGLQCKSSRHESQFKVLYYVWRNNVPQDEAEQLVWQWIRKKHNGFSKDIIRHPQAVKQEIDRQASRIWNHYELSQTYPDNTHNIFHGYISKPDIAEIIKICGASLPRMKFLFHIVKYSYPRRHRPIIGVSREKLVSWSNQRTYQKYLHEFESKGVLRRGTAYHIGLFSKSLKLNWKYQTDTSAILHEGRAVETLGDALRMMFDPRELNELLGCTGISKQHKYEIIKTTYIGKENATHI